jgi:hypothetical protein
VQSALCILLATMACSAMAKTFAMAQEHVLCIKDLLAVGAPKAAMSSFNNVALLDVVLLFLHSQTLQYLDIVYVDDR